MKPLRFLFIAFFLTLVSLCHAEEITEGAAHSPEEAFLRGNIAYGNGDYAAASDAYLAALQNGASPALHYNLGNTFAQLQDWPRAAWHFLKAYTLDPALDDARGNLLLAATRMEGDPRYPSLSEPANLLPPKVWIWIAVGSGWITLLGLFHRHLLPRSLPLARTLTVIACLTGFLALGALYQHQQFQGWGLVLAPEAVPLRLAPTEESPSESTLSPGTPVRLMEARGPFNRVMTTDGAQGFIAAEEAHFLSDS